MSVGKTIDKSVFFGAILGSLVLVNIVGLWLFGRLDLTRDNQFTLSRASRKAITALKDPLTVRAYFTKDLPPPHSSNARYVRDLLDEYRAASGDMFRYEFIDPLSEETQEDKDKKKDVKVDFLGRAVREKTSIERELDSLNIPPRDLPVIEDDRREVRRVYRGLAIKYGEKTESIPDVAETNNLEYDITSLIRKLTRDHTPKVGVVTALPQEELQKRYGRAMSFLGQSYEVSPIDLATTPEIASDIEALVILSPRTPFGASQKKAIDDYVMSGRSVAFLLDTVDADLSTMQANEIDHGLDDLLGAYGVRIDKGLVVDAQAAMLQFVQQQGAMRIMQNAKYHLAPMPQGLDANHPLTRGLAGVAFPFASPVEVSAKEGVKTEVLVKSSERSFVTKAPYNLDPRQRWTVSSPDELKSVGLLATASGALPSYAGQAPTGEGTALDAEAGATGNARLVVAGGSSFLNDQFFNQPTSVLLLNLMDWLLLDEDLLAVRSRGLAAAPLDEVGDAARSGLKYANIFGLPILFVGYGLLRWRMRERRRANIKL